MHIRYYFVGFFWYIIVVVSVSYFLYLQIFGLVFIRVTAIDHVNMYCVYNYSSGFISANYIITS